MLSIIYILVTVLSSVIISRCVPGVAFENLKGGGAVVILGCVLTAGIVGGILPSMLHDMLGWGLGPHWIERTAQLTGFLGFIYMAIRGFTLWFGLFTLGLVFFLAKGLWSFLVYFYSEYQR